jgi:hypothetical protein
MPASAIGEFLRNGMISGPREVKPRKAPAATMCTRTGKIALMGYRDVPA